MQPHRGSRVELLEPRTLLSTWGTVDTLASGQAVRGLASDRAGNVYAVATDGFGNGVIREKPAGSPDVAGSWNTVTTLSDPSGDFGANAIAVDGNGNVFVSGLFGGGHWRVYELPNTSMGLGALTVIDDVPHASGQAIAVDAAGDVFAAGNASTTPSRWMVRKGALDAATAQWTFTTVDQLTGTAVGMTSINAGPAAGVYVVGTNGPTWLVRGTADRGATWKPLDSFRFSTTAPIARATAVAGDAAGNVYVSGYSLNSGDNNGIIRQSADGGQSWSTIDVRHSAIPLAIGADPAGNLYATQNIIEGDGLAHATIRARIDQTWQTADDYAGGGYAAFTADPFGNLYAAGQGGDGLGFIRSAPAPAQPITLDFRYLLTFAQHYGGPGAFTTGDLNGDGQVGFDDLLILAQNFGQTISPLTATTTKIRRRDGRA